MHAGPAPGSVAMTPPMPGPSAPPCYAETQCVWCVVMHRVCTLTTTHAPGLSSSAWVRTPTIQGMDVGCVHRATRERQHVTMEASATLDMMHRAS